MSEELVCEKCGIQRPSDAPFGLCPSCLLKAGLEGVTISFGPATTSVLASFGEAFGNIPPVLLRDPDSVTHPSPIVRPTSDEFADSKNRLPRLQMFGEIARGGMGAVLKGRDADLGRELAVKVLLESHKDKPDMVRRFVEEAQIAGQLQHPGIVPVYELGALGDQRPYFAMKLVKGETLAAVLSKRKPSSEGLPRLLTILESICQTMAYAHARGVIHRDLKPSNVMVGSFGEVQVMDWGLAKVLPQGGVTDDASAGRTKDEATVIATARTGSDVDASLVGSIMGTPAYMAPEQARGEVDQLDQRVDVFAIGSIFCEMLTGQPAFLGRNSGEIQRKAARGDLSDALARLNALDRCYDTELIDLAKVCLAIEPEDRPRNAGEVASRLSDYQGRVQTRLRQSEIEQAEQRARAEEATKRVSVERQRLRLTFALATTLFILMAIGGSAGFGFYQRRQTRLTSLGATLARIETLREQAAGDGPDSPRRREALASADIAMNSLGTLGQSVPGQRLASIRDELTLDQTRAERGQKLLEDVERIRPRRSQIMEDWESLAELQFREAFQKFGIDLEASSSDEVIENLKMLPVSIVRGLIRNLDRWIVIRHDHFQHGGSDSVDPLLQRVLSVIKNLDADVERNRLREFLLQRDLATVLTTLTEIASQPSLLDSGPEMPLLLSRLLTRASDSKTALDVLRKSVLRYPGDLWTNLDLANLSEAPTDALRFFTAARALEPQMGFCLSEMFECGMYKSEGSTLIRKELARIEPDNLNNLISVTYGLRKNHLEDEARTLEDLSYDYLRDAINRDPRDTTARGKFAMLSFFLGQYDQAISAFQEVSRLEPTDAECKYWLGLLLRHKGRQLDAAKEFLEATRLSPSNIDYQDALAVALKDANDQDGEVAALREAIRLDEDNRRGMNTSSNRIYVQSIPSTVSRILGDFSSAHSQGYLAGRKYRLEGFGSSAGRYKALCNALVENGDVEGGIAVIRGAISAYPDEIDHRLCLVKLLKTQGQFDLAKVEEDKSIEHFRAMLHSKPEDIQLNVRLAGLLEQRGRIEESMDAYRTAIAAQPKSIEFHNGLAALLDRQSLIAESEREIDQVIDILTEQLQAKEETGVIDQLGMTLLRRGKRLDAKKQFLCEVELASNPSSACNSIAWELATNPNAKLRDGELAVEFAKRGCEISDWKDFMILDTLAAAYAETGDFDSAIRWQEKAIELSSNAKQKEEFADRLKLYKTKVAFHRSPPVD